MSCTSFLKLISIVTLLILTVMRVGVNKAIGKCDGKEAEEEIIYGFIDKILTYGIIALLSLSCDITNEIGGDSIGRERDISGSHRSFAAVFSLFGGIKG